MAELIRIGIEKANEDLKKENEAKLSQQVRFFLFFLRLYS
jgi:hypothetical protein